MQATTFRPVTFESVLICVSEQPHKFTLSNFKGAGCSGGKFSAYPKPFVWQVRPNDHETTHMPFLHKDCVSAPVEVFPVSHLLFI